ncbi:F-box/LRR-repeat protein 12 [Aplysia californica]|uniref:F-box/LRR-repeat protein 12 n=1 Tax=Aplysia californica TaxID=6500 RepID=A0ABM0JEG4_APLCA|nr:F-box/LRR-repeat protein 12 [Aplysia californica]
MASSHCLSEESDSGVGGTSNTNSHSVDYENGDLDLDCSADKINQFPEALVLEILRYLPVKERCIAGRVCKRWRRIVSDNSLWRHVDLLQYRLDLPRMWKVLRAHFSPCLLTMKVKGFAHAASRKRKKMSVSDSMMKELSFRCPNLTVLHLHDCNTENLSFDSLPCSITSLSITSSSWTPRWFKDKHDHLPSMHTLNLTSTIRLDRFDLEDIALMSGLKKLSLCGCYRVRGSDIEVVAKKLVNLESLNLSSTNIDDLGIHHITHNLVNLRELFLDSCEVISDASLASIGVCLTKLYMLDISHADKVTMEGLKALFRLDKLKFVTFVREKKLTQEELQSFKKGFLQRITVVG